MYSKGNLKDFGATEHGVVLEPVHDLGTSTC